MPRQPVTFVLLWSVLSLAPVPAVGDSSPGTRMQNCSELHVLTNSVMIVCQHKVYVYEASWLFLPMVGQCRNSSGGSRNFERVVRLAHTLS